MSILETKNLIKNFEGVHAVDSLSVKILPNRITGILGPNGSGKTTLINVISGMHKIDSGSVVVSGKSLSSIKPLLVPELGITRTFQNVRVFEQMTVLDNILVVLTEKQIWGALFERHHEKHLEKAKEVLTKVGIWEKRNSLAENLSYGQRKLLEVGRALAMNSNIYLFDEPFAGMFPEMVKRVAGILKELKERGKTVILIEHNMELIRELCDFVIVMDAGKLLAQGKPEEVLSQRNVIEAYLGE